MSKLEVGSPVKLVNVDGYETALPELKKDMVGVINALVTAPTTPEATEFIDLVYFMPHNELKSYIMPAHRVELMTDDEAEAAGLGDWDIPELEM